MDPEKTSEHRTSSEGNWSCNQTAWVTYYGVAWRGESTTGALDFSQGAGGAQKLQLGLKMFKKSHEYFISYYKP